MILFEHETETALIEKEELEKLKVSETIDIDFGGHYLIQYEKIDEHVLETTGKGMNGYGEPITVKEKTILINEGNI